MLPFIDKREQAATVEASANARWTSGTSPFTAEPGLYSIDNIPIFVKGISSGDVVAAEQEAGELRFKRLIRSSTNSVFRLYLSDISDAQGARESFPRLGCESEKSHLPKLVAVEIPGTAAIEPVAALLDEGAGSGRWEYEEGVLRHPISIPTAD